jgi:DNA mismatch repair protein MutS
VQPGPANRSYGLQVAALAGVPQPVIARARTLLAVLEREAANTTSPSLKAEQKTPVPQLALFAPDPEALRLLDGIDPDRLTPREALDWLYRLKAAR